MNTQRSKGAQQPSSFCHDPAIIERAVHVAANAMFLADRQGQIVWINAAFTRLFGYAGAEVMGQTPRILKSGRQSTSYYGELWDTIIAGSIWRGKLCNRRKNGEIFDVEQTVTPVCNAAGEVTHFFVIYEDITERLRSERHLSQLAMFDSLTGLPNRTQFLARLDESLTRSYRSGKSLAVMMLDLDHFKNVNDTLGHAGGDELLRIVGRCLSSTLRTSDIVARLGGDEFAVLIEDLEHTAQSFDSAQRLIESLSEPMVVLGASVQIGASIGIAVSSNQKQTSESLMRNADEALYQAKHQGRGRYLYFDAGMNQAARLRQATKSAMRRSLRDEMIRLSYEPLVRTGTNRIVGVQVRPAWKVAEQDPPLDADLTTVAEQSGMIVAFSDWMLRKTIADIAALRARIKDSVPISVHLSASQFDRADIAAMITGLLTEQAVPGSALRLITSESLTNRSTQAAHRTIEELACFGVQIVLTDFGSGPSSLSVLNRYPICAIKLDKQAVRHVEKNSLDERLLCAITRFASSLEIEIIADGVERAAQREVLAKNGCSITQGALHGEPMSLIELADAILCRNEVQK